MSITVICPSRGRPDKAREAYDAYFMTRASEETKMAVVVDANDPAMGDYMRSDLPLLTVPNKDGGMAGALNIAALALVEECDTLGFIGDDHRFRTPGWDLSIEKALADKKGIAYGNDLARNDIPTQVFISSEIVAALGWMALPGCKHLYLDDTWALLGRGANCLTYLPEVVIEHAHPFFGKGEMDEGYVRVNAPAMYQHDHDVFTDWVESGQAASDIETVMKVVSG